MAGFNRPETQSARYLSPDFFCGSCGSPADPVLIVLESTLRFLDFGHLLDGMRDLRIEGFGIAVLEMQGGHDAVADSCKPDRSRTAPEGFPDFTLEDSARRSAARARSRAWRALWTSAARVSPHSRGSGAQDAFEFQGAFGQGLNQRIQLGENLPVNLRCYLNEKLISGLSGIWHGCYFFLKETPE